MPTSALLNSTRVYIRLLVFLISFCVNVLINMFDRPKHHSRSSIGVCFSTSRTVSTNSHESSLFGTVFVINRLDYNNRIIMTLLELIRRYYLASIGSANMFGTVFYRPLVFVTF